MRRAERVLVTGARLPSSLEIARALHAAGAEVWAADSLTITPTRASNCVRGYFRFPAPALHPREFRATLLERVRSLGITQIVPVFEEVFFLAEMRAALEPHTTLFAPDLSDLRALHSKWQVLARAADCGVRIPRTSRAENAAQLRDQLARHPDSVLKPEYSRGAYQVLLPPHPAAEHATAGHFPWLVQEMLTGRELSTFAITCGGNVLACASYLPRYRAGRGASLYFEPLESPAALSFVRKFAAKNRLTGHLSFDFMENAGELALLECNPRVTSGVHLLRSNEPWGRVYRGEAVEMRAHAEPGCSKTAVLALHGIPALLQGRGKDLLADLRRARDTCFRGDDPLPSIAFPLNGIEIMLRSLAWPVKSKHAYSFDLEWNGGE